MSHQSAAARQLTFDELDTPLRETTFVVVDLETTGSRSGEDAITEIGAVKIRGGEVLGELATLVDPGRTMPPFIVELTGITSAMLVGAPRIERVLPSFLEFARGAVLVAHNAPFDIGFLKAAAAQCDLRWPPFQVLCTVKLARRVLSREEAPSVKLSALASLFAVSTRPTHRALDDARATVDVLHGLFERVGNLGVHSYPELVDYLPNVSAAQRGKRGLAAHLPRTPGVYLFRGPSDEVLYVGTAVNLQRRVRGYFTGSETRARMKEMVALATRVDHVECAHGLEAAVRELRLLAAHAPPYNRRSKFPRRAWWITTTDEPFPRLSVTRRSAPDALGPFGNRTDAADVAATLTEVCRIRSCTKKIRNDQQHGPDCPATAVGGCPAGSDPQGPDEYGRAVEAARRLIRGADDAPLHRLRGRIDELAAAELFENAARLRDRTAALATALRRAQRLTSVAAIDELVAARPRDGGGWEFAVIRAGRLASAGVAARGVPPMPVVDALTLAAETVIDEPSPLRGAMAGEVGLLASWLDSPGVRIVRASAGYAEPSRGAGAWLQWCTLARAASLG
ncbi:DEDD exonuclease domain-containing protein [Rhodococcus sp. NPDC127528]|uniref:DEDD exonuclease domain-containing protein n=1 Tax=unclassified Rhodococcus (in: high G+C Gram-positive bacteria) TaxID=192944 RepID=UPI003645BAB4